MHITLLVVSLTALLKLSTEQTTLVGTSATNTIIPDPSGDRSVVAITHPGNGFHSIAGAVWVCDSANLNPPGGYIMTFQTMFTADCTLNQATLTYTADNQIDIYLNGHYVGHGNDWQVAYTATVDLICGVNNITSVVLNAGPVSSHTIMGLVVSVTQDTTPCVCNVSSILTTSAVNFVNHSALGWDSPTCACACTSSHSCAAPLSWFDYPICGCACPKNYSCPTGQTLNPSSCSCEVDASSDVDSDQKIDSQVFIGLIGLSFLMGLIGLCLGCCLRGRRYTITDRQRLKSEESQVRKTSKEQGPIHKQDKQQHMAVYEIVNEDMQGIRIGPSRK